MLDVCIENKALIVLLPESPQFRDVASLDSLEVQGLLEEVLQGDEADDVEDGEDADGGG